MSREIENMAQQLSGDDRSFGGIVLDSACTGASVVSADEYLRYCRDTGAEYSIEPNSTGVVRFGDAKKGSKQSRVFSLGQAQIRASIDSFGEVFQFWEHVVPGTDTPMLMSLQDLNGLGYEMRKALELYGLRTAITQPSANTLTVRINWHLMTKDVVLSVGVTTRQHFSQTWS
jgi:hypothetical protein